MSVWSDDAVPLRRSSRGRSVTASDVESTASSSLTTPVKETPRKLMHLKNSMIPRLEQIEEMQPAASSEDELFTPALATEQKRGRGRPRKDSTGRSKMTAIQTPASSVAAVKAAAAAVAPSAKRERTPPRSRSSSRSRKSTAATTPQASPAKAAPKIAARLNFDEESPVVARRSTRIAAAKTPASGYGNGSSAHQEAVTITPALSRSSTEQWRVAFTERHPVLTKLFIPAMICLVYALVIIGIVVYFDAHRKAPIWADMVAQRVNDIYDEFMASGTGASGAAKSEI